MKEVIWNALVPELSVTDFNRSLKFYCEKLGFTVRFQRDEPSFAYLELGPVQIMIEQHSDDSWVTGALTPPFGRGVNFQIELPDITAIHARLQAESYPLFEEMEENWYETDATLSGQREFLVQDPDGYLLRFTEHLGEKTLD